jgi:hypothetical protein
VSAEAASLVRELLAMGYSQTDVARGLKMTSRGSGSWVSQVLKGTKGAHRLGELRALVEHAQAAGEVPQGRSKAATAARQRILAEAEVMPAPRLGASGLPAATRKAAPKVLANGSVSITVASAALNGPYGGRQIAEAIEAYAGYGDAGRIALTVVGAFSRQDLKSINQEYWKSYYRKDRRKGGLRTGPGNVMEARFGGGGKDRRSNGGKDERGLSAATWAAYVAAGGTFKGALMEWMEAQGYNVPARLVRVTLHAWLRE